ncbi:cell wall-associated NlpC family hydrolase [Thermocatellispora tengchongensis]|uniref:Cell wall-associated NlpC family hydrolase n=1 Tax=Thermocatellispora tengchongensis TaxID=1073253 RepID=A0A840PRG5_9ACTN|nr:NlpC/P60 family protein [Thermocatellispora tengchongensis]MBB5139697.1 cell wall-associated NlpC family hydrolase [Thermocatellispora tengchongensis]
MRLRRLPVAVGLVAATLLIAPIDGAVADPQPTVAQARAKLEKLNEQADKVVDRFNLARERYKKAKKKYEALNSELKTQESTVEGLRKQLVGVVRSTYQGGDLFGWGGFLAVDDPAAVLGGLASVSQLSAQRARSLDAFDQATKGLRDKRDKAKSAYAEADKVLDDLRKEKAKADRLVAEQTKLLRRLGTYNSGNRNSKGITYTGNASGNARQVLQFAFAQVGKPYQYGGSGPGSWDCSGLTQAAWRAGGVSLPRTTWEQWNWGADRRVSLDALQPGDLVFSNGLGHVGIYAGGGKMVHAPQTGDVVKVVPLSAYGGRLVGAVRP